VVLVEPQVEGSRSMAKAAQLLDGSKRGIELGARRGVASGIRGCGVSCTASSAKAATERRRTSGGRS